ncbi:MAG: hypothetical protein ACI8XO_003031 [Verrucomicrobiales bacterium]|jgi:hypothetical protein
MKTEPNNSTHRLRTRLKIALGLAIIIALLIFGLNRARGGERKFFDTLIALAVENEILSYEAIDGHSARIEL